ncbi:uncharacterized protein LOC114289028 [Camellia sinensis]|uniref:uncharacterized protein LOC114289028 n=1 Tax=Camellia sinensis TaxID=4442 RepID=UPI0010368CA8|nr:uncharacterized protein LOC114289028 [Camellia sinensis]
MYLACERSGQYRATKKLKHDGNNTSRITGTKKCGCPFDIRAHRFITHDEWALTVVCGLHNHPPAEHLEGHSYARRLSKDKKELLMDMSKSMVRPKEILVTLKQRDALNISTLKTIYNVRYRNRVVQRAGRSQIQHLLGELAKYNYIERHRFEESTMTYKKIDNYAWVLATLCDVMDGFVVPTIIVTDRELALMNAIHKIFPSGRHLLCRWHISKNVLTKCKKMFETQQKWEKFNHEWNSVVYSSSEIQYEERLKSLLKEFSSYPDAVKYVMDTWLVPYKEKFVAAWTDTWLRVHMQNLKDNWVHVKSHFRELQGNVSISALEYLHVESKRANSIGIDVEACGCVLRYTHGLPCAHKIADYIRQDCPIPLATIHSQWRQLHISICKKKEETEVSCHAEVELFVNKFNESDRTMQLELLKKLKEIVYPGRTFLVEPKINVSTRRDPCAFELVQSGHDSFSPRDTQITTLASTLETKKKRHVKRKEKENAKGKVYITRTVEPGAYVDAFSSRLKPYIKFVKDVAADGNCGFKAIAASIGHTEDDWAQVRHDLLGELHTHKEEYITLYGSYERFEELTSILSYFEDSPGYSHWMTMPDMGHLVASCYNLVLYHLSLQQCLTFLPLKTVPVPQLDRREIAIGFVNGNHFVWVLLQPGHRVPPIATNWRKYRHPCTVNWDDAYVRCIQHFKDIIYDNVATRETFDVVNVT